MDKTFLLLFAVLLSATNCQQTQTSPKVQSPSPTTRVVRPLPAGAPSELKKLLDGALAQTDVTTAYDPSYVAIDYPNGDVPEETGVCSDVIVRAFRKAGIDLQKEIHEDMKAARSAYPTKWGATAIDPNIDHRRVLNLMTYFDRKGKTLSISSEASDYLPGDIVAWDLGGGVDHIGIVTNYWTESGNRHLIVHNIGAGARVQDGLFAWKITGHYRYYK